MNETPDLQHSSPPLPVAGNWCAVSYPVNTSKDAAPNLADAVMIDITPVSDAALFNSVANVEKKVSLCGGKVGYGWNLTQFHSSREKCNLIEATAHAVWVSDDGRTVDVTPSASSNKIQSCFIPVGKTWKVLPNSIFFAPSKASQPTLVELRQILAAKHVARKYMQKNGLKAGAKAAVDMPALQAFCQRMIKDADLNIVFQFVRYEMCRLKII